MKPLGNNVVVKKKPREMVRPSGIIIPETASDPNSEWGVVVSGNEKVSEGREVLYFGKHCYAEGDMKLVHVKKILLCDGDVLEGNILYAPDTLYNVPETKLEIPDTSKRLNTEGEVVSIGADVEEVALGDPIVCRDGSPIHVILDQEDYLIVNEKNVLYVRK